MLYSTGMYQYFNLFGDNGVSIIAEIPINKDVWAFAYKEDDRVLRYICRPTKGRIKEDRYFYEYKVNGKDLKKNGVSIYARYFADTYEETVKGFNILVQERIDSLAKEIERLQDMLIE